MHKQLQHISGVLHEVSASGNLRQLRSLPDGADFCSNDYLGMAKDPERAIRIQALHAAAKHWQHGGSGSRLICGNSSWAIQTEAYIAAVHKQESALLFPSGYMANLALWSSLPQRTDTVILDACVHRSVHDGCRLSGARRWKFTHNDLNHLEDLLRRATGHCYVGVESLYSMDGDIAPLPELTALCQRYGAALMVDEAHALGVWGMGLIHHYGLQDQVLATTLTYGKAMGTHGAAIVGPNLLRQYLINRASPLIYSTAPPDSQWIGIRAAYDILPERGNAVAVLRERIRQWGLYGLTTYSAAESPIQIVRIPGNRQVKAVQKQLSRSGLNCYAVCSPTVATGSERLRICLHSFNTAETVDQLASALQSLL